MTLDEAKEMLDLWMKAEKAVTTGQSYSIAGRTLERVDAKFIADRIRHYEAKVEGLKSGRGAGARVLRVMPRDL